MRPSGSRALPYFAVILYFTTVDAAILSSPSSGQDEKPRAQLSCACETKDQQILVMEQQLLLKDRVMEQQLLSKDQQIRALELENERLTRLALENHGETGKAHQQANVEQPKPYTAAASPLSTPTPAPIAAYRHGFSQPSALRVDLLHG